METKAISSQYNDLSDFLIKHSVNNKNIESDNKKK